MGPNHTTRNSGLTSYEGYHLLADLYLRMVALVTLYCRPEIVQGEQCVGAPLMERFGAPATGPGCLKFCT